MAVIPALATPCLILFNTPPSASLPNGNSCLLPIPSLPGSNGNILPGHPPIAVLTAHWMVFLIESFQGQFILTSYNDEIILCLPVNFAVG